MQFPTTIPEATSLPITISAEQLAATAAHADSQKKGRFTPQQTATLEDLFLQNAKPSNKDLHGVASQLGLSLHQKLKVHIMPDLERHKANDMADHNGMSLIEIDMTNTAENELNEKPMPSAVLSVQDDAADSPMPSSTDGGLLDDLPLVDGGLRDPSAVLKYVKALNSAPTTQEKQSIIEIMLNPNTTPEVLTSFVHIKSVKGLILLRQLLSEAKETRNDLAPNILKLLLRLPVDIETLKASKIGKVVKNCMADESATSETTSKRSHDDSSADKTDAKKMKTTNSTSSKQSVTESTTKQSAPQPLPKIKKSDSAARAGKSRLLSNATLLGNVKDDTKVDTEPVVTPETESIPEPAPTIESPMEVVTPSYRKVVEVEDSPMPEASSETDLEKMDSTASLISTTSSFGEPVKVRSILSKKITLDVDPAKPRKKAKSVKFAAPGDLVKVKLFHVDEEARDHTSSYKSARDFDRQEGRIAMDHMRELVATTDWETPSVEKGVNSVEAGIQTQRELSTIGQTYFSVADIPKTPVEPDEPYTVFGNEVPVNIVFEDAQEGVGHETAVAQLPQSQPILQGNNVNLLSSLLQQQAGNMQMGGQAQPNMASNNLLLQLQLQCPDERVDRCLSEIESTLLAMIIDDPPDTSSSSSSLVTLIHLLGLEDLPSAISADAFSNVTHSAYLHKSQNARLKLLRLLLKAQRENPWIPYHPYRLLNANSKNTPSDIVKWEVWCLLPVLKVELEHLILDDLVALCGTDEKKVDGAGFGKEGWTCLAWVAYATASDNLSAEKGVAKRIVMSLSGRVYVYLHRLLEIAEKEVDVGNKAPLHDVNNGIEVLDGQHRDFV
ncbi:hypothetical protein HDV05_006212 [Chytridiales sp. JEL 0842]|nr:hypothetical protein HDV05_006212 [Chytridiales sp. JEL 0842]